MSMFIRQLLIYQALKRQSPQPSLAPTARYRAYDMTNDSEGKEILKDLTGNGHDIQLKNFLFAEGSGYGKYAYDFTKFEINSVRGAIEERTQNYFRIVKVNAAASPILFYYSSGAVSNKLSIKGLDSSSKKLIYMYINQSGTPENFIIESDGVHIIPPSYYYRGQFIGFGVDSLGECDITIEQIPDYKGALVSDGVDDYGVCQNFPMLDKDKGYTFIAIRRILNPLNDSLYRWVMTVNGSGTYMEFFGGDYKGVVNVKSFGKANTITGYLKDNISIQTSSSYNGNPILKGDTLGENNNLTLFCDKDLRSYSSVALYALDIYDRDLTDEEIEKVKAEMIAEYEEKTGNVFYQEGIVAAYEAYDKSNDSPDRDVLQDLSGNGHDIMLKNFAFSEGSGYGKYFTNFDLSWYIPSTTNGSKTADKIILTGIKDDNADKRVKCSKAWKVGDKIKMKVKISGIPDEMTDFKFLNESYREYPTIPLQNGVNVIETDIGDTGTYKNTYFIGTVPDEINNNFKIVIEQIPDYKGALVGDGVDDHGICGNFPILTKEKGWTIIALRKYISIQEDKEGILASNALNWSAGDNLGAFLFERFSGKTKKVYSFGGYNEGINYKDDLFVSCISTKYNGNNILRVGTIIGQNKLQILGDAAVSKMSNAALYALEIYNRDLSDEEIAKVKERMIKRYEEKTGEKYGPDQPFLELTPDTLWIEPGEDLEGLVEVRSNTDWEIN